MSATDVDLEQKLFEIAKEYHQKGPGYSQEGVVLREVQSRLGVEDLRDQQKILALWQRLFTEGKLVWGYNLDNPSSPFFHVPE